MSASETSPLVLIRGAGDLATGVALAFRACGFGVLMTEIPTPTAIRRTVSFANAVFVGSQTVEGVRGLRAEPSTWAAIVAGGDVAVLVAPGPDVPAGASPLVVIDAIMAKRNLGTRPRDGAVVVALGPGFTAPTDVDAVIETARGHELGRIIRDGRASDDTGMPGGIEGKAGERVLRAPVDGVVEHVRAIGDIVAAGETVMRVGGRDVAAPFAGCLRGQIAAGLSVPRGLKIGDVDPRGEPSYAHLVSDKARAVGRAALEAALSLGRERGLLRIVAG